MLVTGAGGSIGSELCRQIARVGAGRIVLVDNSEPALFDIERELVGERGFSAALPVLADVGNRTKLRQVFEKYRPDVVFHAAAYKHVPLLEANPLEAVRNNVLATKIVADVAVEFEAKRFVLVSTDKAAQPKNLLGQSKAIAEWIVQAYGQSKALAEWIVESYGSRDDTETRFVAVRFGNVLGSSGSVIPIFRKQIERGGPVTVTHKEMSRYFMTIPEAASLIVQAGAIGVGGHVYVLDMGEPVSIYELAENMIRLSGRSGARHRDPHHRRTARGEAARGALERGRVGRADGPSEDPRRLAGSDRSGMARRGAARAGAARRGGRDARARCANDDDVPRAAARRHDADFLDDLTGPPSSLPGRSRVLDSGHGLVGRSSVGTSRISRAGQAPSPAAEDVTRVQDSGHVSFGLFGLTTAGRRHSIPPVASS